MNTPARVSTLLFSGLLLGSVLLTPDAYVQKVSAQESTAQNTVANQGTLSLTATPLRLGDDDSLVLNPGEKKQIQVEVINTSDVALTVSSSARDFIVEDGETPVALEGARGDNRWSLASWLVLTPNENVLQPRQKAVVTVLIQVPEDALPGGHYAMINHQPSLTSSKAAAGKAAGINQKVGTLLYVRVAGPTNEEAYVRDFMIPQFSEFGPVPYSFSVDNRSDIHIRPKVGISVKNIFGKEVATLKPEDRNIFPMGTRAYSGQWDQIWGYGLYYADLTLSYGTQGNVVLAKTKFWLIPIKLLLALVVVILTGVAAFISIRRHIIHRKQDQSTRIAELEAQLKQAQGQELKQYEE